MNLTQLKPRSPCIKISNPSAARLTILTLDILHFRGPIKAVLATIKKANSVAIFIQLPRTSTLDASKNWFVSIPRPRVTLAARAISSSDHFIPSLHMDAEVCCRDKIADCCIVCSHTSDTHAYFSLSIGSSSSSWCRIVVLLKEVERRRYTLGISDSQQREFQISSTFAKAHCDTR